MAGCGTCWNPFYGDRPCVSPRWLHILIARWGKPVCAQALDRWSRSLEIILRKVPETLLVPTIVSGVLDPAFFKNPLTRLRKDWRQRKLAEVIQILQQIVLNRKFDLMPRVVFGKPITQAELMVDCNGMGLLEAVIHSTRKVLVEQPGLIF